MDQRRRHREQGKLSIGKVLAVSFTTSHFSTTATIFIYSPLDRTLLDHYKLDVEARDAPANCATAFRPQRNHAAHSSPHRRAHHTEQS